MSTNEQTPLSQPTSAVRKTLGKEQAPQNLVRPISDEDLREYYGKNYHQILPIIAEKLHQEKAQQEKLKAVKARLNFEEASRSGSPKPRRGRSKSPREKDPERRTVFKRLEKCVFHRLGDKEKNVSAHSRGSERKSYYSSRRDTESCYQSSRSKETEIASKKHRHRREYSRRTEAVSERHTTDECMHLKRQIEEMLKAEKLSHLIKELKQNHGKDQAKTAKKGETSRKDKPLAILMVRPWLRIARQRITQTFSSESIISFPTLGEEDGKEGPMTIEVEMGGHFVHNMYVDGGSSSEILYEHCFSKFRPEIKNRLIPANTPLVGFSGEIIWPLGQISLLVKIGDEEHSTSAWMNFIVVRSLSPYNGIIGRPGVRKIRAIPSTAHGMLKFPMAGGIVTLRRRRIIPLECSMVSEPEVPRPVINQVTEEKIQVAIHPEYPKQTIAIGSTLTEKRQKELCGLLRRCLPVGQKKMGQAPERNKAISEEVKKLVEADIMKEVHYHSWLSNPVMVKKHDDSWRMCMDFKDLNKACPKDGYPLSEIYWKVESLCGYPYKCFLDAYKGYHQIKMEEEDEEKTAFITSQEIFCYSKMPFGLKNARATYQRLVIRLSKNILAKTWRKKMIDYVSGSCKRSHQRSLDDRKGREAREHDIQYRPRTSVKGQILADFIVERPKEDTPDTSMEDREELSDPWILFTDESSCINGSRAGLIITNPKGMEFTYALRFRLNAINNGAEYEAPIAGLRIAGQIGIRSSRRNVSNNENQFRDNPFKDWCEKLRIKARLRDKNKNWVDEISHVLWAHRTMIKSSNRETPFSLKYGAEAMISAEIGMPTLRTAEVDIVKNNKALEISLDLLKEKREQAAVQEARSKAKMERYYNASVRNTSFHPRDFVYRNNEASHAKDGGKLGPKWEGPYEVTKALGKGAYMLRDRNGHTLLRTWNICNLKKCYMHEM
nr:reverse transcriptase domain-containing protein [Tanacetum cinerariifolium]